jgi:L-proline amide hydrolase
MTIPKPSATGHIPFRDWHTWCRVTGSLESGRAPLVILHGGPGACMDYTLQMANLAVAGDRAVIHYDQLGCGYSTLLPDRGADFWTVELFLDELDNLLAHFGIAGGYHLLGQSWGGMLAAEHAVRAPAGMKSLVICDSPASMDLWALETAKLVAQLPADTQATLAENEAAGTTKSDDYKAAQKVFYDRHVCRVVPNPPEVVEGDRKMYIDPTVYETMNGPNEFYVVGTLREWSVIDRLGNVDAPTLLINGDHDEATDATMQPFADAIADVRWEHFADSSHMPHVEEPQRFNQVVASFLSDHD